MYSVSPGLYIYLSVSLPVHPAPMRFPPTLLLLPPPPTSSLLLAVHRVQPYKHTPTQAAVCRKQLVVLELYTFIALLYIIDQQTIDKCGEGKQQ